MIDSSRTSAIRMAVAWGVALGAVGAIAQPAKAAFHFWAINEVYTNSTGTLQFIEFFTNADDQHFLFNQQVRVTNLGGTLSNTFTFPANLSTNLTSNHSLLLGTAGLQAAGGPAPDFIIPANFLFQAGGTLEFLGTVTNNGPYTALPTDGVLSRDWNSGNNIVNSPTNFAGATGSVPEPSTLVLSSVGAGLYGVMRRRWRRTCVVASH